MYKNLQWHKEKCGQLFFQMRHFVTKLSLLQGFKKTLCRNSDFIAFGVAVPQAFVKWVLVLTGQKWFLNQTRRRWKMSVDQANQMKQQKLNWFQCKNVFSDINYQWVSHLGWDGWGYNVSDLFLKWDLMPGGMQVQQLLSTQPQFECLVLWFLT